MEHILKEEVKEREMTLSDNDNVQAHATLPETSYAAFSPQKFIEHGFSISPKLP
jgi:hypothetical protein